MWVNHHELLRMVRASLPFLFSNGYSSDVTFVRSPGGAAQNLATSEAKTAVAFYCATFVAQAACWNLLSRPWCAAVVAPEVTPNLSNVRRAIT